MFFSLIASLFLLGMTIVAPAHADPLGKLVFLTENYAPYNYEKDGKLQGTSVDLLVKMFQQIGTTRRKSDIKLMNWARGYKLAREVPNTVLFSTTRTPSREDLFKWVGPIAATTISIIAKKNTKVSIASDQDFDHYRIGTVRDDIGELLLLKKGVNRKMIYRTNASINAAKMLVAGRIDMWAYETSVAFWNLKELGEDPRDYSIITNFH